jgi:hypothetical protein
VAEAVGGRFVDERMDDLVVLVSEVVTHSVHYADTEIDLAIEVHETHAVVEVRDFSGITPETIPGPDADGGWGYRLLEGIAIRWGVLAASPGKVIWFEVASR